VPDFTVGVRTGARMPGEVEAMRYAVRELVSKSDTSLGASLIGKRCRLCGAPESEEGSP